MSFKTRDTHVYRVGEEFRIEVRPGSCNWYQGKLNREQTTDLMLFLLGELMKQTAAAVARKVHSP